MDCGARDFDAYMVHDSIWRGAGLKPRDCACQPCLEKRIGRLLTFDDYTICGLNFMCVPGFATEDNYRKLYAQGGLDYDKTKAEYEERCAQLGLESHWTTSESSQTL